MHCTKFEDVLPAWDHSTRIDRHRDSVFWAEGDQRFEDNREIFFQAEAKFLGDRGDHQRGFELCKALPDAAPRAITEWKIRAWRQERFKSVEPALWHKFFRLVKESCVAMHHPLRGEQRRSRRKFIAAETDRFHIHSSHDERRRIEA